MLQQARAIKPLISTFSQKTRCITYLRGTFSSFSPSTLPSAYGKRLLPVPALLDGKYRARLAAPIRDLCCPTFPLSAKKKSGRLLADQEKVKRVQETLERYISCNHVIVFGQPNCPPCEQAKKSLENAGCNDYTVVDVTQEKDAPILLTLLARLTGKAPMVPMVFINGRFIGGGNQCLRLEKSGELEKILRHK